MRVSEFTASSSHGIHNQKWVVGGRGDFGSEKYFTLTRVPLSMVFLKIFQQPIDSHRSQRAEVFIVIHFVIGGYDERVLLPLLGDTGCFSNKILRAS